MVRLILLGFVKGCLLPPLLNGRNYAIWAKAVKVHYLGETQLHYLSDEPPKEGDTTYKAWIAEDA